MKKILILFTIGVCFLASGCLESKKQRAFYTMNTLVEVTLYDGKNQNIDDIEAIYKKYHQYADRNYLYEGLNNIKTINDHAGINFVSVDEDFLMLLNYAIECSKQSLGYFNVLVGNISNVWKEAIEAKSLPSQNELNEYAMFMDIAKIEVKEKAIYIPDKYNLDLGGIAKGYATQKVYEYLLEKKISNYLINAGASNLLLGKHYRNSTFKVGIKKPETNSYFTILNIQDKAVVTSSYDQQFFKNENRIYHHIINPLTLYPENHYQSVTLIGKDSGLLDYLSTTIYSMDIDLLKEFCLNYEIDILIYSNNQIIYQSEGMSNYV